MITAPPRNEIIEAFLGKPTQRVIDFFTNVADALNIETESGNLTIESVTIGSGASTDKRVFENSQKIEQLQSGPSDNFPHAVSELEKRICALEQQRHFSKKPDCVIPENLLSLDSAILSALNQQKTQEINSVMVCVGSSSEDKIKEIMQIQKLIAMQAAQMSAVYDELNRLKRQFEELQDCITS